MPGESGVELLTWLRANHPQVVRILTTAYTDLDSAIASVNSGAIFRYVVKPWEHREMYGVLARAMEFHLVTRERDALLREKLTALQNLVVMDRLRGFAVLAAGLGDRLKNPLPALKNFLDQAPAAIASQAPPPANSTDLWNLAQRESRRLLSLTEGVVHSLFEANHRFTTGHVLTDLLAPAFAEAKAASPGATLEIAPGTPAIAADRDMVQRLARILVALALRADPQAKSLRISAQGGAMVAGKPAVRIAITAGSAGWDHDQVARLYTALSADGSEGKRDADLLSAYFLAHHHGGTVTVHSAPPTGPGFSVLLPLDPATIAEAPAPQDWIEDILTFQREL
jgi:two-component system probable response regulator PhcQ